MTRKLYLRLCLQQPAYWLRDCLKEPSISMQRWHLRVIRLAIRKLDAAQARIRGTA